jgi:hypothetical protein
MSHAALIAAIAITSTAISSAAASDGRRATRVPDKTAPSTT